MNLLSGLEKFGLGQSGDFNILDEGKKTKKDAEKQDVQQTAAPLTEADFLMDKKVKCTICDREFVVRAVLGSKVKRKEPDDDLRPNHEYIDVLKYGVYACPHCGYAALAKDFDHLSPSQRKWIRESVCANFKPADEPKVETYSYDYAVDKYKLALVSTMAKRGKLSEKAYICLNIAWLRREQYEQMPGDTSFYKQKRDVVNEEYEGFYQQAYEGLLKVTSTETPPYYGMDVNTVDYILAQMSVHYKKYDVASKLVSRLLTGASTPKRMKDRCLNLKDRILEETKKQ